MIAAKRTKAERKTNWEELPLLLDTREVADIMACSATSVREMCRRNELPHFIRGRILRIPRDAFRVFMESGGQVM